MSKSDAAADTVVDCRTEFESAPLAVPPTRPRFSWRVDADCRGARQTAYRIRVARAREGLVAGRADCWDSGRVESDRSTNVVYDGTPLEPDASYYWTVTVWNENGERAESGVASFTTALDGEGDWDGAWIGHQPGAGDSFGYRSRWRSEPREEWVQVDLGERRDLSAVELVPAVAFDGATTPDGFDVSSIYAVDGDGSVGGATGFGFPAGYRIEVADDPSFTDATTVVDRTDEDVANPGSDTVAHDVSASGRYVRVTATEPWEFDPADPPNRGPQYRFDHLREEYGTWHAFALASLAVRDGDGETVAGGDVTASSSVESGGWGEAKLVDGAAEPQLGSTSPLLRTEFDCGKPVERAVARVCTLGYGELHVNGEKAGDAVLDPGWTDYDERALYSTYDVTEHLSAGANALGLWLGRGWFAKHRGGWHGTGSPRGILQLTVEYEDGTSRTVTTDPSWAATDSPIVENDIYDGETYDARAEQPGWAEPGFDDADWSDAASMAPPGGELEPQGTPPMRVTETFEPVEITDHEDGPIVDFGQNLTGWVELDVSGADAGDEIRIGHAENLLEDGSLNTIDLRAAAATDTYVASGEGDAAGADGDGESGATTYEPRFTYHGFRYAQVANYPGDVTADDITAKAVHTDMDVRGSFDCSDDDLAQVQHNAEWGLRGNAHSVPTDCPQRDERHGWTGDGHISARAFMYNFDALGFQEKWSRDHDDVQSAHGYLADTVPYGFGGIPEERTWGITRVTVPWHLYRHYGDRGVLERHYEPMRRYVDYWHGESDAGYLADEYGRYGDWLAFENNDGRRGLPHDLFNTAFHYHTVSLFAEIADVLGRESDAERYAALAAETRASFTDEFFDPESAAYGPGTQASYAVPLFFGLVPESDEQDVADALAETVRSDGGKLQTGFLGTRPLIHVLAEYGHEELAYEVVSQPERPGWMYMVRQGATTVWERWDSDDRVGDGMNSFNHSPFTFVSEWFYSTLAGIDFDPSIAEGVEIAPAVVDDLDWAEASVDTVDGEVAARWEHTDEGLALDVTVPWNTTGTVRIPVGDGAAVAEGEAVIWDGVAREEVRGVSAVTKTDGEVVVEVESGEYEFAVSE